MLALLRGCTSESTDPRPHFQALQYCFCARLLFATLLFFIYSYYQNIIQTSILHFYHHLFAEVVHLYSLPLYWVCWGHKKFLVFGCRVVWERPSSSYTSHGLINLGHPLEGKLLLTYKTLRLEAQHVSTTIKLRSRHQALLWRHCQGGECLKVYL